jgi:hypothetical protein
MERTLLSYIVDWYIKLCDKQEELPPEEGVVTECWQKEA